MTHMAAGGEHGLTQKNIFTPLKHKNVKYTFKKKKRKMKGNPRSIVKYPIMSLYGTTVFFISPPSTRWSRQENVQQSRQF